VSPEKKPSPGGAKRQVGEEPVESSTAAAETPRAEPSEENSEATATAAGDAIAETDETPPVKPKRTRATAAAAASGAADGAGEAASDEAAKPKTRRPRTAKAKAEEIAEGPTEAEAEEAAGATAEAADTVAERTVPAEVAAEAVAEDAAAEAPERPKVTRARAAKAKAKKPRVEHHAVEKPEPGRAAIVDADGNEIETVELNEAVFGVRPAVGVLHLVVRAEQAARRRGTASTKTRGEVAGSTAKLYRQKGTGRARAGSAKSPTRTHGGTAFGPKPRRYDIKVNRKVRRKALAMALSDRAAGGDVYVARSLALEEPNAGRVNEFLVGLDIPVPVLVVSDDEPIVARSVRNLRYAEPADVRALSTEQVLRARSLVLTEKAFAVLNEAQQ
jgi:large subunit ribosomal protein L4